MEPFYPALVGDSWAQLPTHVQNLHATHASARGTFRVRRGDGWLSRFVGRCAGMPAAGEHVPVVLAVRRDGGLEWWQRSFGGKGLRTLQWPSGGLLVEALGLVLCFFRLRVEAGALVFDQVRASFGVKRFSIPLPSFLAPSIEGRARDDGGKVRVFVSIRAPIAGFLVSYEGLVEPAHRDDPIEGPP